MKNGGMAVGVSRFMGVLALITCADISAETAKPPVPITRSVMDYGAVGDGVTDDTQAIQKCIDAGFDGVWGNPSRITFPAGRTFRVSHQIVVWAYVNIESDPANPSTILLARATPGFTDPLNVKPMLFSRLTALRPDKVPAGYDYRKDPNCKLGVPNPSPCWPWKWPEDYDSAKLNMWAIHPSAGYNNNFWSQIRNLKFRIEPGNPGAAALHWINAQGTFLYRVDMDLNDAACGILGGASIVDCTIRGGRQAIYDPSMEEGGMVMNSRFSRQMECAYAQETFSPRIWIGNIFESMPVGVRTTAAKNLTMLDCEFRNVSVGIEVAEPKASVFLQNIMAKGTPLIYRDPRTSILGDPLASTIIPMFVNGNITDKGENVDGGIIETTTALPTWLSIPQGFDLEHAANVKDFGAVGNGEADDTEAFRKAIAAKETVFVPAGLYRLTDTVMLGSRTKLVGEHTILSRITYKPGTPPFNDPANPRPLLDTPDDPNGETHIAHLSTESPEPNEGCIGLRWRVGRKSSIMLCGLNAGSNPLLITGNGGGTVFNLWTATGWGMKRGVVVDNNKEPLIFYFLSSEHQQDKSTLFKGAKDVTLYYSSGGEGAAGGDYSDHYVINEMTDCERMAWIGLFTNPGDSSDSLKDRMTILRMTNCSKFWLSQLMRIHSTPVLHTVHATWADGKELDMKNENFSFIREGELNSALRAGELPKVIPTPQATVEIFQPRIMVSGSVVKMNWRAMGGFDAVRVVRRFDRAPMTPDDGDILYEGAETKFKDDTKRQDGIVWYGFYGRKGSGYSKGLTAPAAMGNAAAVSDWLALGPFDSPENQCQLGYDYAFIDETSAEPSAGIKTANLIWTPVDEEGMRGDFVDFLVHFKQFKSSDLVQKAVYLHSWLESDADVTCNMLVGADDGFKIWLNGEVVGGMNRMGVATQDEYSYPVKLKKGWNRLLVKVTQGGGNWMLCARFVMPDGSSPKTGIRTSVEKK